GTVAITVKAPYGTSASVAADVFTYGTGTPPPPQPPPPQPPPPTPTPGALQFSTGSVQVSETAGSATITVTRTGGSDGTVTVHYGTSNGTARAGVNYTATSGTLTFAAGETSKTFQVSILNDHKKTGNLTVQLNLSSPTGSATLGTPTLETLTIADVGRTRNERFVAALYTDMLHRDAETSGLLGWSAMLDAGAPRSVVVQGIENSVEHLGMLVDGLYSKMLGRPSDVGGRAGFVQYLQAGHTLEQAALMMAASPEFSMVNVSDTAFVQALYSKGLGRAASTSEVNMWLAALPTMTRTGVASAVLNSTENRAGVVQQLYGYGLGSPSAPGSLLARVLNRTVAPATGEITGWVGAPVDLRSMETIFAGSDE